MQNVEYRSQKGKTKDSAKCKMEHIKDHVLVKRRKRRHSAKLVLANAGAEMTKWVKKDFLRSHHK
jgi:hypothetical protein